MSVAIPVHVSDEMVRAFGEFKRGKSSQQWLAYRLTGNDMNELELADSGATGESYEAFVERALVADEPRFCFFNFAYDLELDGKRNKTVLILWVPARCKVRAKMIAAASRHVVKKTLGFGFGIELQAHDKADAASACVLEKCKAVSR